MKKRAEKLGLTAETEEWKVFLSPDIKLDVFIFVLCWHYVHYPCGLYCFYCLACSFVSRAAAGGVLIHHVVGGSSHWFVVFLVFIIMFLHWWPTARAPSLSFFHK